jgi:hypothetical protein
MNAELPTRYGLLALLALIITVIVVGFVVAMAL